MIGLEARVSPIFAVRPLDWLSPDPSRFDALMLTSANAAAHAGPALQLYDRLPCYCVGETTASAAREAGLDRIRTGPSDGAALLELMRRDGIGAALHLCGRDHLPLQDPAIQIEHVIVYAAEPVARFSAAAVEALAGGALPLVHSPRAGRLFGELVEAAGLNRSAIRVATISAAAARELGSGWQGVSVAPEPRDQALLELAAKLCKTEPMVGPDLSE